MLPCGHQGGKEEKFSEDCCKMEIVELILQQCKAHWSTDYTWKYYIRLHFRVLIMPADLKHALAWNWTLCQS